MKKGFIILFFFLFGSSTLLFAQSIDSLAIQQELQRLNQIKDSLTNAKDNYQLQNGDVSIPVESNPEKEPNEKLSNFEKVMKQKDKEQHTLRNRILLLAGGFIIMMIWMRRILNKQEQRKQRRKNINPSV